MKAGTNNPIFEGIMAHYDAIIIGTGPAGPALAVCLTDAGYRVETEKILGGPSSGSAATRR
jgi:phytoene dehydrogenase-like protein